MITSFVFYVHISWQPYARLPNDFIPVSLREQDTLGMSQAILLCFEKAVYRRPDESPRQFGLEKGNVCVP